MSKRHRDHGDREHAADPAGGVHPGKRTHSERLAPRASDAASTNAAGASPDAEDDVIGAGDLGLRAPLLGPIIDFVVRDPDAEPVITLITVQKGRRQMPRPYALASVVTPDGHRKIADAFVEKTLDNTTLLRTTARMETMEKLKAVVKFEDELY